MYATALPDPDRHAAFYTGVPAKRALAWFIDTLVTGLLTLLILPFTAFLAVFILPIFFLVVNASYRAMTMASWSATPGMALMGIEIRGHDGHRLDPLTAILHTAGFLMASAFILPQLASAILMLTTPRAQGLHDFALGTAAINRPGRM